MSSNQIPSKEVCAHFHSFDCGRREQCPENCRRKEFYEEYFNDDDEPVEGERIA